MPFSPSAQTARTVQLVARCVDCEKPRVIYASQKLTETEKVLLQQLLDLFEYSCGGSLQELKSPDDCPENELLEKVYVRANITCTSAVEIPYFSVGCFKDVCYNCGIVNNIDRQDGQYPSCPECRESKNVALKRKRNVWAEKTKNKKTKK